MYQPQAHPIDRFLSFAARPSLCDRLGGEPAIGAVVDDFISNVASDPKINARFANANIAHLNQLPVEPICAGAGGPCVYSGHDTQTAHRGMDVRDDEFDALVGDLVKSLEKFKVPDQERGELLALLGPAKRSTPVSSEGFASHFAWLAARSLQSRSRRPMARQPARRPGLSF
jgi:hemoglobin